MNEVMNLTAPQIGIVYLIVLLSTVPGSIIANWISNKMNPMQALKINLFIFVGVNFGAFLNIKDEDDINLAYAVAFLWGCLSGWYFPLVKLIFSIIIPSGQEAELAGFFLYCSQILSWLPPLVFTVMNEAGVHLRWGGMHLNIYLFIGFLFFMYMPHWQECVESAKKKNKMKWNSDQEQTDASGTD